MKYLKKIITKIFKIILLILIVGTAILNTVYSLEKTWNSTYILKIGQLMFYTEKTSVMEPNIKKQDLILIKKQEDYRVNDIIVFTQNGEINMEEYNDQIEGRNAVLEYLESGKDINKILVATGEKHGSINKIIAIAKDRKIIITEIEKSKLNKIAQTENSQGVIAIVPPYDYCEVEDILQTAEERKEKPFIIILDGIEDPHNLGSIIRTAETAGVHGIIIPKRRACGVNSTVSKVSAGAVQHMKIARVNNKK